MAAAYLSHMTRGAFAAFLRASKNQKNIYVAQHKFATKGSSIRLHVDGIVLGLSCRMVVIEKTRWQVHVARVRFYPGSGLTNAWL